GIPLHPYEHPPRVRTGGPGGAAWFRFRTGAVPLQRNWHPPPTVGAPATGANGAGPALWFDSAFAPGAVFLHRNRDTPPTVGAPAPGANGTGTVYWLAFASHRGGAPTIERATPPCRSTRPGCEQTIARPAPRPAVRQTERTASSPPSPL